jgi:hypothetical protein
MFLLDAMEAHSPTGQGEQEGITRQSENARRFRTHNDILQYLTPIDGVVLKATLKRTTSPFDIPPYILCKQILTH